MKKSIGKWKMWAERLRSLLGWVQFGFIAYLFLAQRPLGLDPWLFVVVGAVASVMYLVVDILWIYPSELSYSFVKNKEWTALVQRNAELSNKVDLILAKLET